MIFGHRDSWKKEARGLSPVLAEGLRHLAQTDWKAMPVGRHEVGRQGMFALVSEYETADKKTKQPEAHEKYIDIQWLAEGEEIIGYSQWSKEYEIVEEDLAQRDIVFFAEVQREVDLLLVSGSFAIFFPWDVHRPGCANSQPGKVKKVVLKIPAALIAEQKDSGL